MYPPWSVVSSTGRGPILASFSLAVKRAHRSVVGHVSLTINPWRSVPWDPRVLSSDPTCCLPRERQQAAGRGLRLTLLRLVRVHVGSGVMLPGAPVGEVDAPRRSPAGRHAIAGRVPHRSLCRSRRPIMARVLSGRDQASPLCPSSVVLAHIETAPSRDIVASLSARRSDPRQPPGLEPYSFALRAPPYLVSWSGACMGRDVVQHPGC